MVQVGEIYQDYKVIQKTTKKYNQQYFLVECMVCGHKKNLSTQNIIRQNMSHSSLNCKIDYYKNKIGSYIGDYKIIGLIEQEDFCPLLKLECQVCGNTKVVKGNKILEKEYLHSGLSCGSRYWNWFIGKEFGDFVVLSINHTEKYGDITEYFYDVECMKCHTKGVKSSTALKRTKFKHGAECYKMLNGLYKKEFAYRFGNIKQRCNNPNNEGYKNYGGRGIKCEYEYAIDFYNDFIDEFIEYAKIYGPKKCTFDRIDVNGNYSKDNIRITNYRVQNTNKRGLVYFVAEKDDCRVLCDNTMVFGETYGINGNSLRNVLEGRSKTAGGWSVIAQSQDLDDLKDISVTTKLIISR